MTTTYQTLEESATDEPGQNDSTNIPLPQVGYPSYNGATHPVGQIPDEYRPAYRTRLALKLGIVQIILGTIVVICGVVILVMRVFLFFTGMGIGAGAIFTAAGVFGVVSSRQKATWAIVTCMVLSIVSAVASGVSIIVTAEGIDLQYGHGLRTEVSGMVMHIILIVCCLLEMLVSVIQATSCCRATCCMAGNARPEIMVVYLPQPVMDSNRQYGGTPGPTQLGQATLMVPAQGVIQPGHPIGQNGQIANGVNGSHEFGSSAPYESNA